MRSPACVENLSGKMPGLEHQLEGLEHEVGQQMYTTEWRELVCTENTFLSLSFEKKRCFGDSNDDHGRGQYQMGDFKYYYEL